MSYVVAVLPSAERELDSVPRRDVARILTRIEALSDQPRPMGVQKLRGLVNCYRLRQGRYRILYRIDDRARRVFVYAVGDRKCVASVGNGVFGRAG